MLALVTLQGHLPVGCQLHLLFDNIGWDSTYTLYVTMYDSRREIVQILNAKCKIEDLMP